MGFWTKQQTGNDKESARNLENIRTTTQQTQPLPVQKPQNTVIEMPMDEIETIENDEFKKYDVEQKIPNLQESAQSNEPPLSVKTPEISIDDEEQKLLDQLESIRQEKERVIKEKEERRRLEFLQQTQANTPTVPEIDQNVQVQYLTKDEMLREMFLLMNLINQKLDILLEVKISRHD